jgi:signal transduction histidine kinase
MKSVRRIVFFTFLVVVAVASNYVTEPRFFGFDFLFRGIAVLLILYLYGTLSLSKDVLLQQPGELNDGSLYTEEQTIAPVVAGDDRITHFVSINRKLAEAKLHQNMDELVRANRVKNEFLGVISHELRTPLNVIIGYSQMFKEGAFGAVNLEQSRALDKITLQSAELLRMVNSILAVTKIEADDVSAESDAIDLETFVDGLKDEYNTPVTHGVPIAWDCQPGLPTLISDANKLKHIMQNLVNNALKFTDEGYIKVSVKRLPGEEKIALMVTDTGIGIAKKDLPNIFDKFHQANSSRSGNYIGAGLGLYIVKKYADLLGGEVAVDSVPGKGSTFTITLPLRNVEKARQSNMPDR